MEPPVYLRRLTRVILGEGSRAGRVRGACLGPIFEEFVRAHKPDPSRSPLAHSRLLPRR